MPPTKKGTDFSVPDHKSPISLKSAVVDRAVCPLFPAPRRRKSQAGLTLVELIVAFSILLILTTMAVPMARYQVRREREKELRNDLRDMHTAIDKYKDLCDQRNVQAVRP